MGGTSWTRSLIIQIVSGIVGGNAAGKATPNFDLGTLGNTIAGALGGGAGGQLLQALVPMLAGAAGGGLDVGAILGQVIGGGAGGAVPDRRRRAAEEHDGRCAEGVTERMADVGSERRPAACAAGRYVDQS